MRFFTNIVSYKNNTIEKKMSMINLTETPLSITIISIKTHSIKTLSIANVAITPLSILKVSTMTQQIAQKRHPSLR